MNTKKLNFILLNLLIILAIASRFLPHPPNFTAVISVGIFAGFLFKNKTIGYIVPIIAMVASDIILGFHSTIWAVYLSLIIATLIGARVKKSNIGSITLSSLISATIFYIITNFAVWSNGIMYPMNYSGLISCYISAIPFFGYSLLSTFIFSFILFGLYSLFEKYIFSKQIDNQLN
ncbi:MAG TPA: hypothetical protein PLC04_02415 [Candidatus Kapabacteria bacterium]|jgi:hypothetical protein|nr:hypothetical protein [Candidatus Kapabacteria bacterium]HOV91921.1 hypothetical protein [Candidatus Kapabacteria bacterium]